MRQVYSGGCFWIVENCTCTFDKKNTMRIVPALLLILFCSNSYGQYYFNDLVSTQNSSEQYKLLRSKHIKKITVTSYEPDNTVTEGFGVEENISPDGKKIIQNTALSNGQSSVTTRFYDMGRLSRTQAVNKGIDNKTNYTYTDKGLIQQIIFTTTDTAMKTVLVEAHQWMYDGNGKPVSMLKIKNKTDTMAIELIKDEQGLVIEEHWKRKNRVIETYYYYYDQSGHLTDIVRYNARLKKLLPDFQYEYDANGRVSRMIQVSMSSASYFVWKYTYNDKGLKQTEMGYDKQKQLVGRLEYSYE